MNKLNWKLIRARVGRALVILLVLFGALGAVIHGLLWWVHSGLPGNTSVQAIWQSPDGTHKAVQFTQVGGSAITSYCFEFVSIVGDSVADQKAWDDVSNVFTASCGSLKSVIWKSTDALEIAFDPNRGSRDISALKIKGYANSGRIKVFFVFAEPRAN